MAVVVVTDSAASLPADRARDAGVVVVPMWLTVGGAQHRDGELGLDEIVARLDEGVSTSGPSPGEFVTAIEGPAQADGAVVLTIARSMSSTHDAALTAARLVGGDVRVVDTGTAAGGEGLVVLAAAARAREGASLDEVEAVARHAAGRVRLRATVDGLDHLVRGGRVPGIAGRAGQWLGVQPLFEFRNGHARPLAPAFSRDSALERMLGTWRRSRVEGAALHVAALHAAAAEDATRLLETVTNEVEPATSFVGSFSPVMVAHTGPGLVGLAWWWEEPPAAGGSLG